MNTNFKRKSQIATTVEQGKRLLAAGLDPDSADMSWSKWHNSKWDLWAHGPSVGEFEELQVIPAWSLSKLWDICNDSGIGPFNFGGDDIDSSSLIEKLVHWIILGVHEHEVLDEYLTAETIQELNRDYANH